MYYHKITEYGIKCCMHAHHGVPRAPPGRGELYRRKTLFLADFPIFFYYPNGTWTHPPTSKLFLDFWNSICSGYYFRGRKISRKIQIREYSENFLHAKNWCYTVIEYEYAPNFIATPLLLLRSVIL